MLTRYAEFLLFFFTCFICLYRYYVYMRILAWEFSPNRHRRYNIIYYSRRKHGDVNAWKSFICLFFCFSTHTITVFIFLQLVHQESSSDSRSLFNVIFLIIIIVLWERPWKWFHCVTIRRLNWSDILYSSSAAHTMTKIPISFLYTI